jgi:hypothetical protein
MATLRCTAKYRKALALGEKLPEPSGVVEAHPFGEWYANTLTIQRQPFLHFMNGRVLLSVIVPMRQRRTGEARMVETLERLLLSFGLAAKSLESFLAHATTLEPARAHDRSILASMRDQASVARNTVLGGRASTPWEIMVDLAIMPCGALGYSNPRTETVKLVRSVGAV